MEKINVLTSDIFNLIAAGEVVEKPLNIVKELVENSLDAGADSIRIEIQNGGKSEIKIVDNGSGIYKEDLKKVFYPHATSKIKTKEDLFHLSSLGFRGEAMSSISSVSRVEILSKTKDSNTGYSIKNEFGVAGDIVEAPCNDGTTVIVSDLFEILPARLKFLRRDGLEERDITHLVEKLIIANPFIKIEYLANDKLIYKTMGQGLLEALYIIYGKESAESLMEVNETYNSIRVKGYISKPTLAKHNKTYQTIMVNGRVVSSSLIGASVASAYDGYLMKGKYPMFALNIIVDYDKVDVNIHPSKLEVKFENSQKVFGAVYQAVTTTILNNTTLQQENDILEMSREKELLNMQMQNKNANENEDFVGASFVEREDEKDKTILPSEVDLGSEESIGIRENFQRVSTESSFANNAYNMAEDLNNFLGKTEANEMHSPSGIFDKMINRDYENTNVQNEIALKQEKEQTRMDINSGEIKILANMYNTFILLEYDGKYYLLDQHAGHERLLYDQFSSKQKSITTKQMLLIPLIMDLNSAEMSVLEENLDKFSNLGLDITVFGEHTIKLDSVPVILSGADIETLIGDILAEMIENKNVKNIEMVEDKLKMKACKSAVKAHDQLSEGEIKILIEMFLKNDSVLLCPHGRPSLVEITEKELEKFFKRIV